MAKKIESFLKSIGISDVEKYDLDFVLVARNPYKREQVDMAIEKYSPWSYPVLEEFLSAIANIRYPYTIRFSYPNGIACEDVCTLFADWHMAHFYDYPSFPIGGEGENSIVAGFESKQQLDAEEPKLREFESMLYFLNYDFAIRRVLIGPAASEAPSEIHEPEANVTEQVEEAVELHEELQPAEFNMDDQPMDAKQSEELAEIQEQVEEEASPVAQEQIEEEVKTQEESKPYEEEETPAEEESVRVPPEAFPMHIEPQSHNATPSELSDDDIPDLTAEDNDIAQSLPDVVEYRTYHDGSENESTSPADSNSDTEELAPQEPTETDSDEAEVTQEMAADPEPAQTLEQSEPEPLPAEKLEESEEAVEPQPAENGSMSPAVFAPAEPAQDEWVAEEIVPLPDEIEAAREEEPQITTVEEARALIASEHKAALESGEEDLMKQMEANLAAYKDAQNSKRLWTKGNYRLLTSIDEIYHIGLENVDFDGVVFESTAKLTRKGKMSANIGIGDSESAVNVRAFENAKMTGPFLEGIKVGQRFRIRGSIDNDRFTGQKVVVAHFMDILPPKETRPDPEEEKRVELHLHTNMSVMDGLPEMDAYCRVAKGMGMKAIAVTDHGVVQAFPSAQSAAKKAGLKMIYGVELYMFDIDQTYIINPCNTPLKGAKYCVFDTETTGLSARYDRIIEFGGVLIEGGRVTRRFDKFINPEMPLPEDSAAINHITEDDVKDAPTFAELWPEIKEFLGDNILVAHNATFDIGFLNASLKRMGLPPISNPVIDTLAISHYMFPEAGRHNEGALLRNLGLSIYNEKEAHRADYDASALSDGWQEILIRLEKQFPGIVHADLANLSVDPPDPNDPDEEHKKKQASIYNSYCRHLREYHATVLVKNQKGLSDLYRVISEGHTTYLARVPKTPRSLIQKYRENFLVGSACFNGEIFELAMTREIDQLAKAMEFYDYIELQPVENYSYLIDMGRISSKERLYEILRDIVTAAGMAGKPVVATGDCHYVDPEDKILRDVYISAKGIGNGSHPLFPPAREKKPMFPNPDQHFRSTREMLDSFMQWTDEEKAREYVITNSNMIADMIDDNVIPVSDDLFPPNANLPNSADKLRELCYTNFEKRYGGNQDPEVKARIEEIRARLDQELNGIIGHGYSVTYYIAHILIKMANEEPEHYIVGSRGSVGSSFAATMADITEVNALPPHYLCPKCHYFEWGDAQKYKSGFDLPDKTCPQCGAKLVQNGQNIPFETFLGFNANKVPDIDLNFEEESQHKAHNYTKQLLGASNVFRAGTIETVAEKTAFGYVRNFMKLMGKDPDTIPPAYIAYIASRCQGVKRTTGQHPGGIVVVPSDKSVFDFTAIQHPADDLESEWLTTHYDFRSMHDEILKFDILGHVDPMAMRYYRDLTGVRIEDIPMNDPKVLSLFTSPKELNLRDNWLNQQTGAAALPEFGTDLAQRMLLEADPKCFNDLLIISGLAHGTNVWSGNAEDLILNKVTDINGVIGCRDDIMTYLISMGIPNDISFKIMEDVRKGKKLKPDYEAMMREKKVPEYYIESCNKIHYLFPRGHATAYVMMAVRVAYFKLYYPLEFYAVFFSIRSDDWDIAAMIQGEDAVKHGITELRTRQNDRDNPLKPKEVNILKTLQIALEMLERGYKFANIDLYRSDAKMFVVDHENKCLIPPFSVIDGLGVNAAQSVVEARSDGKKFLSKEDLIRRTKLNNTNVADLDKLGVLDGLGETNQMSLFEFM